MFGIGREWRTAHRRWRLYVLATAVVIFVAQLVVPGNPLLARPGEGGEVVDTPAPVGASEAAGLNLVWREFDMAQRLAESPASWICGAALQLEPGRSTLVVRLCREQPTAPERRFGLGYDSFLVEAYLPDGQRLSYSLLEYTPTGPSTATDFRSGPTSSNGIAVNAAFVRDATDIVIVFGRAVSAGLLTVSVYGSFHGEAFSEMREFAPLGAASDFTELEVAHEAVAPLWARRR